MSTITFDQRMIIRIFLRILYQGIVLVYESILYYSCKADLNKKTQYDNFDWNSSFNDLANCSISLTMKFWFTHTQWEIPWSFNRTSRWTIFGYFCLTIKQDNFSSISKYFHQS